MLRYSTVIAAVFLAAAAHADEAKPQAPGTAPATVTLPEAKQWNVVAAYLRFASENFTRAGDAQDARNALLAADVITQQAGPRQPSDPSVKAPIGTAP